MRAWRQGTSVEAECDRGGCPHDSPFRPDARQGTSNLGQVSVSAEVQGWIGAIGTGGGFLLAASVFAASFRDLRRKKATLVNAWLDGSAPEIHTRNGSDEPVYDVLIQSRKRTPTGGGSNILLMVLGPGEEDTTEIDGDESSVWFDGLDISFTDSAGRRWQRSPPRYRLRRAFNRIVVERET